MRPEVYVARIERLERDNAVLKEALRAFVLNATFSMHEIGARCATGEYGDGEQRDFDLGIRFCRRGAMLGDMECQWDYAMMLYSGEHMPQDKRARRFTGSGKPRKPLWTNRDAGKTRSMCAKSSNASSPKRNPILPQRNESPPAPCRAETSPMDVQGIDLKIRRCCEKIRTRNARCNMQQSFPPKKRTPEKIDAFPFFSPGPPDFKPSWPPV